MAIGVFCDDVVAGSVVTFTRASGSSPSLMIDMTSEATPLSPSGPVTRVASCTLMPSPTRKSVPFPVGPWVFTVLSKPW